MGKAFNCTATLSVVTLAAGVTKKLTEKPALGSVTVPPKPKMRCSGVGEMGTRAPIPATLLTPLRLQLTLTISSDATPGRDGKVMGTVAMRVQAPLAGTAMSAAMS